MLFKSIAAAKKNGVKFGHPYMELPSNWTSLYNHWKSGQIKAVEFMAQVESNVLQKG